MKFAKKFRKIVKLKMNFLKFSLFLISIPLIFASSQTVDKCPDLKPFPGLDKERFAKYPWNVQNAFIPIYNETIVCFTIEFTLKENGEEIEIIERREMKGNKCEVNVMQHPMKIPGEIKFEAVKSNGEKYFSQVTYCLDFF